MNQYSDKKAKDQLPINSIHCPGCGAIVPAVEGPTHRYLGASAGCWEIYTEILAKEYSDFQYPDCHRLTVDTYAVQHPGAPSRQSIQSVCGHLVSLYLVLECGFDSKEATRALAKITGRPLSFEWLEPPASPDWLTILDIRGEYSLKNHQRQVHIWARSVWNAWSIHHDRVRRWAAL